MTPIAWVMIRSINHVLLAPRIQFVSTPSREILLWLTSRLLLFAYLFLGKNTSVPAKSDTQTVIAHAKDGRCMFDAKTDC
jgi:hypothetical protein